MLRVRPRRADSVTSTSSTESGALGGDDSFAVDQGPTEQPEAEVEPGQSESDIAKATAEKAKEKGVECEEVRLTYEQAVAKAREADRAIAAEDEELAMWDLSLLETSGTARSEADKEAEVREEEELAADAKKKTPIRATVTDGEIEAQMEVTF